MENGQRHGGVLGAPEDGHGRHEGGGADDS